MKILTFGCLHATPESAYSKPLPSGGTTHLERVGKTFEWLSGLVGNYEPDFLINLGDTIDTTGFIHTSTLTFVSEGMRELARCCDAIGTKFFNLIGNHDKEAGRFHNLCWFNKDLVVDHTRYLDTKEGPRILLVPWLQDMSNHDQFASHNADLVFSHLPLYGAQFDNGEEDKSEDAFPPQLFTMPDCEIPGGPYLFGGHYHRPSMIGKNVYIVGSVLTRNFRDVTSTTELERGAMLVKTSKKGLTVERLENPHAIRFYTGNMRSLDDLELLKDKSLEPDRAAIRITYPVEYEEEVKKATKPFFHRVLRRKVEEVKTRDTKISLLSKPEDNLKRYTELEGVDLEGLGRHELQKRVLPILKDYKDKRTSTKEVEFLSVEVENFLSIGKASFEYRNSGIVGLRGNNRDEQANDNGSGKTALVMDAPFWVLTGQLLTRDGRGDDVCHDKKRGGTFGKLCFSVNGDVYEVSRGRKHKELKNGIKVVQNGEEFKHRRPSDRQKALDDILGEGFYDYLKTSVFLGEGLEGRLSQLKYADRARLLEQYIVTGPYDYVQNRVSASLRSLDDQLSNIDAMLPLLDEELNKKRGRISELTVKKQNQDVKASVDIAVLQQAISVKQEEILGKKRELSSTMANLDLLKVSCAEVESEITSMEGEAKKLRSNFQHADAHQKQAYAEYERIKGLVEAGKCDKCGTPISSMDETTVERARVKWTGFYETCQSAMVAEDNHNSEISNLRHKLKGLTNEVLPLNETINRLRMEIDGGRVSIREMQNNIIHLQGGTAHLQEEIDRLDKEQAEVVDKISKNRSRQEELQREQALFVWWKKHLHLKGFRSFLLDQLVSYMNARLEELSQYVFSDAVVRLSTDRETKGGKERNEVEIHLDGYRSFRLLSSGERRRVDILLQLVQAITAASLSIFSSNVIVMDEIFDKLDKTGLDSMMDLLYHVSRDIWLLITSHNPLVSESIDEQWVMVKEEGNSRLAA